MTLQKDVTVKMHHYAHLQTEEDCEEMMFVSAGSIPENGVSGQIYRFANITGAAVFKPNNPVGKVTVRHFSIFKIVRQIISSRSKNYFHWS